MKLEARNIGKRHKHRQGQWLFRELDLTIASGEIIGLQGASGCGKSTLCRILAGIESAEEGEVLLGELNSPDRVNELDKFNEINNANRLIRYDKWQFRGKWRQSEINASSGYRPVQLVFQHPERAVNPRWRVKNILREGWEPDQELLDDLQIQASWLERFPAELSGGQLQRVCIARTLSPQTQFLLADEMTTMLDAITQAQIWRTVLAIAARRKMGLLVVSHDKHLLKRICSRVIEMP